MVRQYIEENLRKLTKSDIINIIREIPNEEKSYNATLDYECQRYKELDEEAFVQNKCMDVENPELFEEWCKEANKHLEDYL